jgi:hypothetical protein
MGTFLHQYFWSKQDAEDKVIAVIKHLKESQLQKGFGGKENKTKKAKVIAVVKHLKDSQLQKEIGGK